MKPTAPRPLYLLFSLVTASFHLNTVNSIKKKNIEF